MPYFWHMTRRFLTLSLLLILLSCTQREESLAISLPQDPALLTGAARVSLYLPSLKGKRVGVVCNHTSLVGGRHLVDTLLSHDVDIVKIFSPEHGFRGTADAGAKVQNGKDPKTGLPIVSLYGKHRMPTTNDLQDLDVVLFDLQDVGVRFYTYISTLSLVMEAAAKNAVPVTVLDRPNPNGHYVDGPILQDGYSSFVGLHPVPIVYGMTIGEYGKMVNGEGWLSDGLACALQVVPCKNYRREQLYELPVPPSPNLPNSRAIALYPSLCLLEGTVVSVGRGTDLQFQVYGHPTYRDSSWSFTPRPNIGAQHPKLEGERCYGVNLSDVRVDSIRKEKALNLSYLLDAYRQMGHPSDFFLGNHFIDKLAGSDDLRRQVPAGKTEEEIRQSWQKDLERFMPIRSKYLIYP